MTRLPLSAAAKEIPSIHPRPRRAHRRPSARCACHRAAHNAQYDGQADAGADRARRHLKNGGLSGDFGPELEDAINCEVMRRMAEILSEPAQAVAD